jgi:hypothetical protein
MPPYLHASFQLDSRKGSFAFPKCYLLQSLIHSQSWFGHTKLTRTYDWINRERKRCHVCGVPPRHSWCEAVPFPFWSHWCTGTGDEVFPTTTLESVTSSLTSEPNSSWSFISYHRFLHAGHDLLAFNEELLYLPTLPHNWLFPCPSTTVRIASIGSRSSCYSSAGENFEI